jgi:hypothetical protein
MSAAGVDLMLVRLHNRIQRRLAVGCCVLFGRRCRSISEKGTTRAPLAGRRIDAQFFPRTSVELTGLRDR